jgi:hypothetical protein
LWKVVEERTGTKRDVWVEVVALSMLGSVYIYMGGGERGDKREILLYEGSLEFLCDQKLLVMVPC